MTFLILGAITFLTLASLTILWFRRKNQKTYTFDEQEAKQYQSELEAYLKRDKDTFDIGLSYERQIGYLLETEEYDVTFHGAVNKFNDLGMDLIAHKNSETLIIQTKCLAHWKTVHEKYVFQLYGSAEYYRKTNPKRKNIKRFVYSPTGFGEKAQHVAEVLEVGFRKVKMDSKYPMIKCTIDENGTRKFYLPMDENYDHVKVDYKKGDRYVLTIEEAMTEGYKRAG